MVKDYWKAQLDRKIQNIVGGNLLKYYLRIINSNQLPEFTVTRDNIMADEEIFRSNLGSLKGKITRRELPEVIMI